MTGGSDHVIVDVESLSVQVGCDGAQSLETLRRLPDTCPGDAFDAKALRTSTEGAEVGPASSTATTILKTTGDLKQLPDGSTAAILHDSDGESGALVECRICREDDEVKNLEVPCDCTGSLKFAHRKCIQRWCNEKGDTCCEICHQPYRGGYVQLPRPHELLGPVHLREDILLAQQGHRIVFRDPRMFAAAAGDHRVLNVNTAEYEEYARGVDPGASWCRSAALILLALLLLQHAFAMLADPQEDDPAIITLFMLRVVAFLLPCYIMARALSILQLRRRQQEAALDSAADIAFLLQANRRLLNINANSGRAGGRGAAGSSSEDGGSSSSSPSTPRSASSEDNHGDGGNSSASHQPVEAV